MSSSRIKKPKNKIKLIEPFKSTTRTDKTPQTQKSNFPKSKNKRNCEKE